jgi:hypothetical protein
MDPKNTPVGEVEEVDFSDMDFDFERYFDRYFVNETPALRLVSAVETDPPLTEQDRTEFDWRVIGFFCQSVFQSEKETGNIPFWVANYVAKKLLQMIGGVPWDQLVQAPYQQPVTMFSRLGERAMEIYCAVENGRRSGDDVTSLIAAQASERNVSYETARADYYKVKKSIDSGAGLPDGFLKP